MFDIFGLTFMVRIVHFYCIRIALVFAFDQGLVLVAVDYTA